MDILRKVFQKDKIIKENDNKKTEKKERKYAFVKPNEMFKKDTLEEEIMYIYQPEKIPSIKLDEGKEVVLDNTILRNKLEDSIYNIHDDYIITFNKKMPKKYFVSALKNFKSQLPHDSGMINAEYKCFRDSLLAEEDSGPLETRTAFLRILASCMSKNSQEYLQKVESLGKSSDDEWKVITHVMGEKNIAELFNMENIFYQ
ncbi:hypothetical protein KJ855_03710 [Patescibacteria group bacterium]|nr:hypothetical protein [Patescibacteria group bacterium]